MKNKIKIVKKRKIFQFESPAKDFKFFSYTLLFPNGQMDEFFVRQAQPFSIIVPQLDDSNLIMVKQYRLGSQKISLEFPMGSVFGLSPREMAEKELKEETGFSCKSLRRIGQFYLSPAWSNQKAYVFLAKDLIAGKPKPEPYEFIEVVKVKISKIEELILKGEICDAPTIVAFYYYKAVFGKSSGNLRKI